MFLVSGAVGVFGVALISHCSRAQILRLDKEKSNESGKMKEKEVPGVKKRRPKKRKGKKWKA